jgi:hypothetical protein
MSYAHRCVFCDYSRPASTPTILSPRCRRCGAVLEAVDVPEEPARSAPSLVLGHKRERLAWSVWVAFCLALVALACAAAWATAGPALGIAALGGGILAVAPLAGPPTRS